MSVNKDEIVYADERAIMAYEKEIDKVWNESEAAKDKGDMGLYSTLQSKVRELREPLEAMRWLALQHVNGKELETGPVSVEGARSRTGAKARS
jgi:hypothetical protein